MDGYIWLIEVLKGQLINVAFLLIEIFLLKNICIMWR